MEKTFLGVGWNFPIELQTTDNNMLDIRHAQYEESVRQSIRIILGTAKGERVMRPAFGCGIHDLVFAPNNPSTTGQVAHAVREALLLFEPRINVVDVKVDTGGRGELLLITVEYRVQATNNVFNLVYPFYLERTAV